MKTELSQVVSHKAKSRVLAALAGLLVAMLVLASCPKNYGYGPFEALSSASKLSEMITETGAASGIYATAVALGTYYYTNSSAGTSTISRSSSATFYLYYQNKTGSSYSGLANDAVDLYYSDSPIAMYTTNLSGNAAGFLGTISLLASSFASTTYGSSYLILTIPATNMNRLTASKIYWVGARSRINGNSFSLPAADLNLAKISVY